MHNDQDKAYSEAALHLGEKGGGGGLQGRHAVFIRMEPA